MVYAVSLVNSLADLIGVRVFLVRPKNDREKELVSETKNEGRADSHRPIEINVQH